MMRCRYQPYMRLKTNLPQTGNSKKNGLHFCKPLVYWRRVPESNRPTRICNPVHNRFANAPYGGVQGVARIVLNRRLKTIWGKLLAFPK